jgi:hypothetical protein
MQASIELQPPIIEVFNFYTCYHYKFITLRLTSSPPRSPPHLAVHSPAPASDSLESQITFRDHTGSISNAIPKPTVELVYPLTKLHENAPQNDNFDDG